MNEIHERATNVIYRDLCSAPQAKSGRRSKLWKVKKTEEKPEKSDGEKVLGGERRKKASMRRTGGDGGRQRRRERITVTTTTTTINKNNNDNNNNKKVSQGEEGQKQNRRRRTRRRSENDLQDDKSPSSGTSGYVPAAAGRMGALLARARRALSERRHRSVSQGSPRAFSSPSSDEITSDEPPLGKSECAPEACFKARRGSRIVAAWGTPPPRPPDALSRPSVRRRGSLDSLGYPTSAASTSLG